jgi:hypothetical protein
MKWASAEGCSPTSAFRPFDARLADKRTLLNSARAVSLRISTQLSIEAPLIACRRQRILGVVTENLDNFGERKLPVCERVVAHCLSGALGIGRYPYFVSGPERKVVPCCRIVKNICPFTIRQKFARCEYWPMVVKRVKVPRFRLSHRFETVSYS